MPHLFLLLQRRHWQYYRFLLKQVDIRQSLISAGIYLTTVFTLHIALMMSLEGMTFGDATWLTLTTVVTVGYGDHVASTFLGRLATVVLLYLGGIFVLFHVAADYFEYRSERRLAMIRGRWRWSMQDHVLILNSPTINRDRFIIGLAAELRRGHKHCDCPILLLSRDFPEGLPEAFQEAGVVHYHGEATSPEDLVAAGADQAAFIIALAENAEHQRSDEITFDILDRLREVGAKGRTMVECVLDRNRERLQRAGAYIVMRPVRFYPEIMVRAINAPGTEVILEKLFTIAGDECVGFEVTICGRRWEDVVQRLMGRKLGTAIGYRSRCGGEVRCNPDPDEVTNADAVFMIAPSERRVSQEMVQAALGDFAAPPGPAALTRAASA